MTTLTQIDPGKIRANPFRMKKYELHEAKLEVLEESIERTGFWPNIMARKNGSGYELAYGHHRLEAAIRKNLKRVGVLVQDLDDDEMLRIFARENNELWGAHADQALETVETVVKRYADGLIENMPQPDPIVKRVRYAPSFVEGKIKESDPDSLMPYTSQTIAEYLGWQRRSELLKIQASLRALEARERETVDKSHLAGLTTEQCNTVVTDATAARKRAEAEAKAAGKSDEQVEAAGIFAGTRVACAESEAIDAGKVTDDGDTRDLTIREQREVGKAADPTKPKNEPPRVERCLDRLIKWAMGLLADSPEVRVNELEEIVKYKENIEDVDLLVELADELDALAERATSYASCVRPSKKMLTRKV